MTGLIEQIIGCTLRQSALRDRNGILDMVFSCKHRAGGFTSSAKASCKKAVNRKGYLMELNAHCFIG